MRVCVCVIQRRDLEHADVTTDVRTDRRVSCYAGGTSSRRNTRSSLNAVCSGRSALNTRSQVLDRDAPPVPRHRYAPNVGGGHQERVLQANSTAASVAPPPPDAAVLVVASTAGNDNEDRPSARGGRAPASQPRRPLTVTVLSERRPPPTLPYDLHPRRPRSPGTATSDDNDRHRQACSTAAAAAQVDVVVSRTNHHIRDNNSDASPSPPSSTPPQQQQQQQHEQQHIV